MGAVVGTASRAGRVFTDIPLLEVVRNVSPTVMLLMMLRVLGNRFLPAVVIVIAD